MKIVALSRLRKLHNAFLKTENYVIEMNRIIRRLLRSATERQAKLMWSGSDEVVSFPPLFTGNGRDGRYLVVAITSDNGLNGASNVQVIQKTVEVIEYLQSQKKEITILCFGTIGSDIIKRFNLNEKIYTIKRKFSDGSEPYLDAERLTVGLLNEFDRDRFDVCMLVYNKFKSIVSQRPTIDQVIPNKICVGKNPWQFIIDTNDPDYIKRDVFGEKKISLQQTALLKALGIDAFTHLGALSDDFLAASTRLPESYDYEPSDLEILHQILPQYLVSYINRVLLETEVGDNAARLMAMDNATKNAEDMLKQLKKQYSRTRQSKITTDIIEVVSGSLET
jgi:F-type H+-transporting ATPase subunit gamma